MTDRYRIALAQLNPVMGDIAGNLSLARKARENARDADVILFSELFIVGYSPEDLVLKPALQEDARAAVEELAKDTVSGPAILMGTPWVEGGKLYNAVALLDGGKIAGVTGLVMTKLDGTARGGILVALAARFNLPIHFIGVGEQVDDLQPFEARDFARAIAGLDA